MSELPAELRGDGPCDDCGTLDNIVWFTESVLWNDVVKAQGADKILCIPCFVKRVDAAGYFPTGWRLTAEWHWETRAERETRRNPPRCIHTAWSCDHCHDDPPPRHTCPRCGATSRESA